MSRLFWKILIWFWIALALLSLSVGWGVKTYVERAQPHQQLPQAQVAAISLAFEQGDTGRARNLLLKLNNKTHYPIFVLNNRGMDILGRPLPPLISRLARHGKLQKSRLFVSQVTLPDDTIYQVVAPRQSQSQTPPPPWWLALSIALVTSTLVCIWLARYLSAPISRLQDAVRHLASGKLDVRVGSLQGRKDEIADLASDFDKMAEKIQELLNAQQQLLRDVSHELRSPLARLQVALALARRHQNDATELDRIERDLLRLEALISEVLTLSRLETTGLEHAHNPIDLSDLILDIIEDNKLEAAQKNCTLLAEITPNIIHIGSAELLHRAIDNIIRNAIKYTDNNTVITSSLKMTHQGLEISVCDSGPGVAEDQLTSMFEPFVRLDSARQHQTGGYGLGLSIARKAVELHKGTISAHNQKNGTGLCIRLYLPTKTDQKS